jgi:hypothetical protein
MKRQQQTAHELSQRFRDREVQIRRVFISRFESETSSVPPLAQMIRGGRGGSVRLKVYLSMLWAGALPPHDVTYPARTWAALIGLDDIDVNGARRVRAALQWLEAHRYVRREENLGQPSTIVIRHESGTGEPYSVPGAALAAQKERGEPFDRRDFYVKLPHTFWTSGWIAELSGPAVTALLLTLDALARRLADDGDPPREVWFGGRASKARYDISEDVRSAGLRQLVAFGVLSLHQRRVETTVDFKRTRYAYQFHAERLRTPPGEGKPVRA